MASNPKRLGRPPASSSAKTRLRILDVARRCFADLGYEAATNRRIAAEAGITTGALYHYFDSKLDLYLAVHDDVGRRVFNRFAAAADDLDTFIEKFEAVLETAHELNREDPTLARFLGAARTDAARLGELADALGGAARLGDTRYFERMVDRGIATGEIDASDRRIVIALIRTVLVGLTDAVSDDFREHRDAVDAIERLLVGKLFRPAPDG